MEVFSDTYMKLVARKSFSIKFKETKEADMLEVSCATGELMGNCLLLMQIKTNQVQ